MAVLRPLTGFLGRAFEEAGYNVSYLALYDNVGDNSDAVTPNFVIRSGSLVSKTTHNKLVYNNPGPLGAVLAAKKVFTLLWDCYNAARTRRYLKSLGKDTVILTSMTNIAEYLMDYARKDQKRGIGYLYEFHNAFDSFYRTTREKTLQDIGRYYDSFISLSEGDAELFAQWLKRPVDVVSNPNAFITSEIQKKVMGIAQQKKPIIQYVGRYGAEKGLTRILESFVACAPEFPEWILKLNGSGDGDDETERQMHELLETLEPALAERIVVGGPLSSEQVLEAYAEASLTICASDFEGGPMSLQEGMRVGTPLVSYPSSYLLLDYLPEFGYLAEERSVEALTKQLRLAIGDDELRAKKSALCVEKSSIFSPEYIVQCWEKVFGSIHR
ncbi:glycosyltransferase [Rothia mucilaginosa]|uniref:glycosyltransferase n=1 Tax=Rothia mucilaginosa TaxID=43675 RepID=UPI0034D3A14D